MNLIKLGKKGQVSIPQGVLRQLGIAPDTPLLVETTADGAIVLRQVSVHPIEIYSDERLAEFAREDRMTPAQAARAKPMLDRFNAMLLARSASKGLRVAEPGVGYTALSASAGRVTGPRPAAKKSTPVKPSAKASR